MKASQEYKKVEYIIKLCTGDPDDDDSDLTWDTSRLKDPPDQLVSNIIATKSSAQLRLAHILSIEMKNNHQAYFVVGSRTQPGFRICVNLNKLTLPIYTEKHWLTVVFLNKFHAPLVTANAITAKGIKEDRTHQCKWRLVPNEKQVVCTGPSLLWINSDEIQNIILNKEECLAGKVNTALYSPNIESLPTMIRKIFSQIPEKLIYSAKERDTDYYFDGAFLNQLFESANKFFLPESNFQCLSSQHLPPSIGKLLAKFLFISDTARLAQINKKSAGLLDEKTKSSVTIMAGNPSTGP